MVDKLAGLSIGQKITLLVVISAALLVATFMFLMKPTIVKLREMPERQQLEKQKYNMSLIQIEHLKSVKKESAKTLVELTQLDQMMPKDKEIPALMVDIQEIADNAGVQFASIAPFEKVPGNKYYEIPLELKINCQFYELVDFMYQLEKLPRRIKVKAIQITEAETHLPDLLAVINCSAFVYDLSSKVETVGAPVVAPPPPK